VRSFQELVKAYHLDEEILSPDIQTLKEDIYVLEVKMHQARDEAENAPEENPELWDIFKQAQKNYQDALSKISASEDAVSATKSSSAGDADSAEARIKELEEDIAFYEKLIEIVFDEPTPATEATDDYQKLWDAYYKAHADHADAVKEFAAAKNALSDKSSSVGGVAKSVPPDIKKIEQDIAYWQRQVDNALIRAKKPKKNLISFLS